MNAVCRRSVIEVRSKVRKWKLHLYDSHNKRFEASLESWETHVAAADVAIPERNFLFSRDWGSRLFLVRGTSLHRFHYVVITGASAQISGQSRPNLSLGGVRVFL